MTLTSNERRLYLLGILYGVFAERYMDMGEVFGAQVVKANMTKVLAELRVADLTDTEVAELEPTINYAMEKVPHL